MRQSVPLRRQSNGPDPRRDTVPFPGTEGCQLPWNPVAQLVAIEPKVLQVAQRVERRRDRARQTVVLKRERFQVGQGAELRRDPAGQLVAAQQAETAGFPARRVPPGWGPSDGCPAGRGSPGWPVRRVAPGSGRSTRCGPAWRDCRLLSAPSAAGIGPERRLSLQHQYPQVRQRSQRGRWNLAGQRVVPEIQNLQLAEVAQGRLGSGPLAVRSDHSRSRPVTTSAVPSGRPTPPGM